AESAGEQGMTASRRRCKRGSAMALSTSAAMGLQSARGALRACRTLGVLVMLGAFVMAASADPASSAGSAWSALPSERDSASSDPLERRGGDVFDQRCAACHDDVPDRIFG